MIFEFTAGLLGLIGVPLLILIYVLKRRYQEETVSSTFLWRRSLKYMKRRFPWSWRNSLLLILQILTIVLASFVLARPSVMAWKTGEVIAIVDASASMMSEDYLGNTRFDRALDDIEKLAEEADANHRVTVIVAGAQAETHVFRSDSYYDIMRGLNGLTCTYGTADLEGALALAEFAQEKNTEAEIRLYTDKEYGYTDGVRIMDMTNDEWNVAALGLDAQEVGGVWEFTGHVASYGGDVNFNASLYVDGEHVSSKKVSCKDGVVTDIDFRDYEAYNFQIAQMILELPGEETDAIQADNTYSYYNTLSQRKRIQIAFAPNMKDEFLDSALRSIKNVSVSTITVDALEEGKYEKLTDNLNNPIVSNLKTTGYDLYVYVGMLPREMPSDGAVWIFNPPQLEHEEGSNTIVEMPDEIDLTFERVHTYPIEEGKEGVSKGYSLINNTLLDDRFSSISKGLSLSDVKVGSYAPIVIGDNSSFVPLLFCDESDVVLAGTITEEHHRILVMSIATSNLSTQMADYILLMSNLVTFSCPNYIDDSSYTIGEMANLVMPAGATKVTITLNGDIINVLDAADMTYSFDRPGNYAFKISLSSQENSALDETPTKTLYCFAHLAADDSNIFGEEPSIEAFPLPEGLETELEMVEIWIYLLILLFIILTAEWWVYYCV